MRLLAFNGFSGDSDATSPPMQSPSISTGALEQREGIQGRRARRRGWNDSGRQRESKDMAVRPSVLSLFGTAPKPAGVTPEDGRRLVLVQGRNGYEPGGSGWACVSRSRWMTGVQLS